MTHLTREELQRWRDAPTPEMRERVVAHFAECDACCGAYAELMRTRADDAEPTLDAARFRERGYRVRTAGRTSRFSSAWFKPVAVLAASLVVVVAAWRLRSVPDDASPGDASPGGGLTRGTARQIELLNPANDAAVDASVSFEWRAEADSACRLRVYDPNRPEAPLVERTAASGDRLSSAEVGRFASGITYRWFVECRSPRGDTATSQSGRFGWR
jgi:hypothetical protein